MQTGLAPGAATDAQPDPVRAAGGFAIPAVRSMMVLRVVKAAVYAVFVLGVYIVGWALGLVDREGRYPWEG